MIDFDLAGEAAIRFYKSEFIQCFYFLVRDRWKYLIGENINMTVTADAHATADAFNRKVGGFTGFHDIEAEVTGDFNGVPCTIAIEDLDRD